MRFSACVRVGLAVALGTFGVVTGFGKPPVPPTPVTAEADVSSPLLDGEHSA